MPLKLASRPALLINEGQRGVLDAEIALFPGVAQHAAARGVIPAIVVLADAFRAGGHPVLHMPVAHRPDFADVSPNTMIGAMAIKHRRMAAGSADAEFMPALRPQPRDHVVDRTGGIIALLASPVDAILRRMGIGTIVLAGASTNVGIAGCALAAAEMGYTVWVAEDCIAGSDDAAHAAILDNQVRMMARIVSRHEIIAALQG